MHKPWILILFAFVVEAVHHQHIECRDAIASAASKTARAAASVCMVKRRLDTRASGVWVRVMDNAVRISHIDGVCTPVTVRRANDRTWWWKTVQLHIHHQALGVALLSPVSRDELEHEATTVFQRMLPPPLDAYIYPETLIAALYEPSTDKVGAFTPASFKDLCARFVRHAQRDEEVQAVYDVPAVPIDYEMEDDGEYPSGEEDDFEETSDAENASNLDEDEEWDEEEEDVRSVV